MTVSQETHNKLRKLQDLLSHQIPDGDPAVITDKALDLLLAMTLKQKAALTDRPRRTDRARKKGDRTTKVQRPRAVPAAVRREVWERDGGRCAFVDDQGRQCNATRRIEFHHAVPFAMGGEHAAKNIELRCQAHNQYEAEIAYGQSFMDDRRARRTLPLGIREGLPVYRRLLRHDPSTVRVDVPQAAGRVPHASGPSP